MILDLRALPAGPRPFEGIEPVSILELQNDPYVAPVGAVSYRFSVERVQQRLLVRGSVHAQVELRCVRCQERVIGQVEDKAVSLCLKLAPNQEFVDLTNDIREAIIVALPPYPVCGPDCRGLCSQCGANLNRITCGCSSGPRDSRWDVLDVLNPG